MNIKVLGVSGSIRSNSSAFKILDSVVRQSGSTQELRDGLRACGKVFSNSDIALAHSMFTALQSGAEVEMLSLKGMFRELAQSGDDEAAAEGADHLAMDSERLDEMMSRLRQADGVILSTPVYFGDRSSIANKFMQLTVKTKALENKVFGAIGVGAKRNGGQETTCIYCLMEALAQGAIAVGNGPVTAQYGGTVVAGDPGAALDDDWGLERCLELGRRVVVAADIYSAGVAKAQDEPLKLAVLMTMDGQDKKFRARTEAFFKQYQDAKGLQVEILDLVDHPIKRCIGCSVCPKKGKSVDERRYNCIVQDKDDAVVAVYERLMACDAVAIVGVNANDDLVYRYQAFTERTRSIRRDNFQMNNMPVVGFLHNDPLASNNTLHNTKVITSYIRHNTFMLKPIQVIYDADRVVFETDFDAALAQMKAIKAGRLEASDMQISYNAEGYADKSQDDIASARL